MGGRLEVNSQPEQGSTFTLTLPLPETQDELVVAARARSIVGLEAGQEGLRILVVDDKEDNRELLKLLLEGLGFAVRTANDGQQAVEAFQHWQPCFIWMDVRMPIMDGYAATRMIRSLPGGDAVKIVALTASVFEEDRAAVLAAGWAFLAWAVSSFPPMMAPAIPPMTVPGGPAIMLAATLPRRAPLSAAE